MAHKRALWANVMVADAERIRGLLAGQTINSYLRSLISADLEELGEPPLAKLEGPRQPKRPVPPIEHGTLSAYTNHHCRCQPCRQARLAYYRRWKAAGACARL